MKKFKWVSLFLFLVALLAILCFHSRFDLIDRITPPSEMWGRHGQAGITVFKKDPVVFAENGMLHILYGDEADFQHAVLDEAGELTAAEPLGISGYNREKLVKYQGTSKLLLWTENYDLYASAYRDKEKTRRKVASNINDFHLFKSGNALYLAVAEKEKLELYQIKDGVIETLSEYNVNESLKYVTGCGDNKGGVYLLTAAALSPTEYGMRVLGYDSRSGKLYERTQPVIIENNYTTREGSNSINNLKIALDDEDIYIFYEIGKMSGQGMVARTYMGRLPQNLDGVQTLKFERLKLEMQADEPEPFLSTLSLVKEQGEVLTAIVAAPARRLGEDEGSELVYITIDKGVVLEEVLATNTRRWCSNAQIERVGDTYAASFLRTLGDSKYQVGITSSGETYKNRYNKTTKEDVINTLMEVAAAYMFVFFPVFINLLVTAPILFWPICVDFFEWKYFFDRPNLTYRIGIVLEGLVMVYSMLNIYKNPESVSFMPAILTFPGAPFFYLLLTFGTTYGILHFYRKGSRDMHPLPELGLFLLIHNTLMYFLYSVYMVRF